MSTRPLYNTVVENFNYSESSVAFYFESDSVFPSTNLLNFKNLEYVFISYERSYDKHVNHPVELRLDTMAMKSLTNLRYIEIVGAQLIGDWTFLGNHVQIQGLSFNFCGILREQLNSLIPANLEYLNLEYNMITDINPIIEKCQKLEFLRINGNPLNSLPTIRSESLVTFESYDCFFVSQEYRFELEYDFLINTGSWPDFDFTSINIGENTQGLETLLFSPHFKSLVITIDSNDDLYALNKHIRALPFKIRRAYRKMEIRYSNCKPNKDYFKYLNVWNKLKLYCFLY